MVFKKKERKKAKDWIIESENLYLEGNLWAPTLLMGHFHLSWVNG